MNRTIAWIVWTVLLLTSAYGIGMGLIFGLVAIDDPSGTVTTAVLASTAALFGGWTCLSARCMRQRRHGWGLGTAALLMPLWFGIALIAAWAAGW